MECTWQVFSYKASRVNFDAWRQRMPMFNRSVDVHIWDGAPYCEQHGIVKFTRPISGSDAQHLIRELHDGAWPLTLFPVANGLGSRVANEIIRHARDLQIYREGGIQPVTLFEMNTAIFQLEEGV